METPPHASALLAVVAVLAVVGAGCVSGGPGGTPGATTSTPTVTDTSPTGSGAEANTNPGADPGDSSAGADCGTPLSVAYWGLSKDEFWSKDAVRVGYSLPPDASVLLVTFVDGSARGVSVERNSNADHAVAADGAELQLNASLSGEREIRTVAYRDGNGDGRFQRGVDEPCHEDGAPVRAGPETVNFSRFGA